MLLRDRVDVLPIGGLFPDVNIDQIGLRVDERGQDANPVLNRVPLVAGEAPGRGLIAGQAVWVAG